MPTLASGIALTIATLYAFGVRQLLKLKQYWSEVAQLGCVVCLRPAQLHHVRGGSCRGLAGMGQKANDWLVIPLCMEHHTGSLGIHATTNSVTEWEQRNGRQSYHLRKVSAKLGVNILAMADLDASAFDADLPLGRAPAWWPTLTAKEARRLSSRLEP